MSFFHPGKPMGDSHSLRSRSAWLTMLVTAVAGLLADQYSKGWAFNTVAGYPVTLTADHPAIDEPTIMLPPHDGMDALPGPLIRFRLALNRGAVFGIASDRRALLILLTSLALLGATAVFALRTFHHQTSAHVAIGCILAGGIGNLIDRLRFGVVRDFIQLLPEARLGGDRRWPGGSPDLMPWVFNIADLLLLAGTILFLGVLWRTRLSHESGAIEDPVEPEATS